MELKGKCGLLVEKKKTKKNPPTNFITGIFLFLEGRLAYNIEQWDETVELQSDPEVESSYLYYM